MDSCMWAKINKTDFATTKQICQSRRYSIHKATFNKPEAWEHTKVREHCNRRWRNGGKREVKKRVTKGGRSSSGPPFHVGLLLAAPRKGGGAKTPPFLGQRTNSDVLSSVDPCFFFFFDRLCPSRSLTKKKKIGNRESGIESYF